MISLSRNALVVSGIALLILLLALTLWSINLLVGNNAVAISVTATPTKTPAAPPAPAQGPGIMLARARLPTPTPESTPTPALTPVPTPAQTPAPERLAAIARSYGLNPAGDYIIIDQDAQTMFLVRQGQLQRTMPVTTGDASQGWETPAWFGVVGESWGTFQGAGGVMADDGWWLFQRGGNFLIHSLPYTLDADGQKHYAGRTDLGLAPASHGCIRLAPDDAQWFTAWQPQGKPIIILPLGE